MNKQFKERLTGAVILVIFVVIVVPALLSGPPRPAAPTTSAAGEGPPLRSYTIDLTDPATAQPPIATAPPVADHPVTTTRAPAPPPEDAPASRMAKPAVDTPAAAGAGFAIQIGSFANRANADGLVAKLRRQGFPAFMSPTSGARRLYRVRVGPVADRADAQIMATRLAAAGQAGKVVTHP